MGSNHLSSYVISRVVDSLWMLDVVLACDCPLVSRFFLVVKECSLSHFGLYECPWTQLVGKLCTLVLIVPTIVVRWVSFLDTLPSLGKRRVESHCKRGSLWHICPRLLTGRRRGVKLDMVVNCGDIEMQWMIHQWTRGDFQSDLGFTLATFCCLICLREPLAIFMWRVFVSCWFYTEIDEHLHFDFFPRFVSGVMLWVCDFLIDHAACKNLFV